MVERRRLVAGNWKMNGRKAGGVALARDLAERCTSAEALPAEVVVCPPATLIWPVAEAVAGSPLLVGGQDCHAAETGAFTGSVAAAMLAEAGCQYVIVGHSERRRDHGETNADVAAKGRAAVAAGMAPIVCIGESADERDRGEAVAVVCAQLTASLDGLLDRKPTSIRPVVAYEPIWAIGTGRSATPGEIAEMHARIRAHLAVLGGDAQAMRILYGGSVNAGNAAEILALSDVDGALVGGASLKSGDFWCIVTAIS